MVIIHGTYLISVSMQCVYLSLQPSWYVQSLLFHLCLEVNKVGGHAVPRITLTELLRACLDQVLTEYDKLTQSTQNKVTVCLPLRLSLFMSLSSTLFFFFFPLVLCPSVLLPFI